MDELLKMWRDDTPGCAHRMHLNNAGAGLMPRTVVETMTGSLDREAHFGGYESADAAAAIGRKEARDP